MGLGVAGHPDLDLRAPDFDFMTPLFVEMRIATKYLHGPHSKFLELPEDERMKLILFDEMQMSIENHFSKKNKTDQQKEERKRELAQNRGSKKGR